MLRTYRIYNLIVGFSKYEFYNKLLGDITLLRTTTGVTQTQHTHTYITTYCKPKVSPVSLIL